MAKKDLRATLENRGSSLVNSILNAKPVAVPANTEVEDLNDVEDADVAKEDKRLSPRATVGRGRPRKDAPKSLWSADRVQKTSVVLQKEQFKRLEDLAYQKRLTIREVIYRILALGFEEFDKKGDF